MGTKQSKTSKDNKGDKMIFSLATSKKLYKMGTKMLGSGAFGKVYPGRSILNPDLQVAIKCYKKKDLFNDDIHSIEGEIKNLRSLDHPNIVKYFEAVEDSKHLFIITEFCHGQTLGKYINSHENSIMHEEEAAYIMEQLLSAVNHCHSNNIAHRDLKPDNIMVDKLSNVTIIDYGLSKLVSKTGSLKSQAGCPYFMAPEILNENYNLKCDIWSLGVILYIMLSGYLPFPGESEEEILENILKGEIKFSESVWKNVSESAIHLISMMLSRKYKTRISAKGALEHEWFSILKGETTAHDIDNVDRDILESLQFFECESPFKKAVLNILVKMIPDDEYNELRLEFRKIDEDGDGML